MRGRAANGPRFVSWQGRCARFAVRTSGGGAPMPSNCTKPRIEWVPGPAARDALALAEDLFPGMGRQSVIDRLVITGLSAYVTRPWQPPALAGRARHRWKLPEDLANKLNPGNGGS